MLKCYFSTSSSEQAELVTGDLFEVVVLNAEGDSGMSSGSCNAIAFGLWIPDVLWLTPRLRMMREEGFFLIRMKKGRKY